MIFDLIRGRTIRRETPEYYLFDADAEGLPGFWVLEPRKPGIRAKWIFHVLNHLDQYNRMDALRPGDEGLPKIDFDTTLLRPHSYHYFYRGGPVRIIPQRSQVEIALNHPALDRVANILCDLMPRTGRVPSNPKILWVE